MLLMGGTSVPRKAVPKQKTSLALSAEAQQLLALMAARSGISPSAALESAIREKAQREKVILLAPVEGNGADAEPEAERAVGRTTPIDLRPLAARAAAGDASAAAEIQRIIAELRATATITPAKRPEELDPDWQERFVALIEGVRRGVPEEWTEEELQEQIAQAISEVRANRAGDHGRERARRSNVNHAH
jgi:hypothetical protein